MTADFDATETRAAVDALVYRLKNRAEDADDELIAVEFITALRGRGWRPTNARPLPDWNQQPSAPTGPDVYARGGALWRDLYENRKTGPLQVLTDDTAPGAGAA